MYSLTPFTPQIELSILTKRVHIVIGWNKFDYKYHTFETGIRCKWCVNKNRVPGEVFFLKQKFVGWSITRELWRQNPQQGVITVRLKMLKVQFGVKVQQMRDWLLSGKTPDRTR